MRIKTEKALCINCGREFIRRARMGNPRKYCDAERCQKVKNIKNSVAKFSDLPSPTMSINREGINYHGAPNL